MKFSPALLLAVALAEDKKVPPRHPLHRLEHLVKFSDELLRNWFSWLPSNHKWILKFAKNAERMKSNFNRGNQRCGYYDKDNLPHGGPELTRKTPDQERERRADDDVFRYNRDDPYVGTKQITTGFRKWAERYLSACSGQKTFSYQVKRMNKWNEKLQAHLTNNAPATTEAMWKPHSLCGGFSEFLDGKEQEGCLGECCIQWCKGMGFAFL